MGPLRRLDELVDKVKGQKNRRVAVACGHDPNTIHAAARTVREGVADVTLVGDGEKVRALSTEFGLEPGLFDVVGEAGEMEAGRKALEMVRGGEAHILMKGLIGTEKYMRLILDKECGLLPPGAVLSHVGILEAPEHPKLLIVSDVAVIPYPDIGQKIKMIGYCVDVARALGIDTPKVAIIAATEKVSVKMQPTVDAAVIRTMADRGQIKGAIVDGPLALDVAVSPECCTIKGLKSPVGGDADVLIFPNIEAGNSFYKSVTRIAKGRLAAIVAGTTAPCVLTSRADDEDSKFLSIVLAASMAAETGP
jgi:phosphate butyryltransferase